MEFTIDDIKSCVQSVITEMNDKSTAYETRINELNEVVAQKDAVIAEKDTVIVETNATIEQVQKALKDMEAERDSWWAEREALQKQLGELRAEKRLAEMNEALSVYTEEEKKFAEVEINAFNSDPINGDIEAIKAKICVGIVEKQKSDAKVAEMNQVTEIETIDIFSEICEAETEEEDINIF